MCRTYRRPIAISVISLLIVKLLLASSILIWPLRALAEDAKSSLALNAGFYANSFPDFSKEDLEVSLKVLTEELGKDTGVETHVSIYEDIDALRNDFSQGNINFVVASATVLATEFSLEQLADGFRLVRSNEATDTVYVLGQNKPGLSDFKDYKGKRLILAQNDPIAELYMDYLARLNFKQSVKNSFKILHPELKAHQLILKLFFDQADITCVFHNAYQVAIDLNPQLQRKLQVLAKLENIPQGAGLFNNRVSADFREQVIDSALKLSDRPRGQQLLQLFKSDQVIRATPADLQGAKKLYEMHQQLFQGR